MPFPRSVREQALVLAARHCCVCHRYKGVKIEVHHLEQEADGGGNDLENAIALCFDCHADAGHYNPDHPRGTNFSPRELRMARATWHRLVQENAANTAIREEIQSDMGRAIATGTDPDGLQIRSLELADEIAHFLEQRFKDYQPPDEWIPSMPGRSTMDFHNMETCRLYWQRFREPVAELRKEVALKMNLFNPDLDAAHNKRPSDNGGIYSVINGLRGLAETIAGG